jgi:hypothetical protein
MKIGRFLLDYIDPSLKERTGEAIHNRYHNPKVPLKYLKSQDQFQKNYIKIP